MAKGYVFFNPLSGNGRGEELSQKLRTLVSDPLEFYDMTRITNYSSLIGGMEGEDYIILAGGDGTLNRFINDTSGLDISREIFYYPTGTGNDFAFELGIKAEAGPVSVSRYLKDLPSVEVKGKTYRFLNGVGYGIDGYCCEIGDKLRAIPGKKVNYTAIAIKGLLFHFDARNARVTVDDRHYTFKKVWIAPTMHGKCYGGGMIAAPEQDRLSEDRKLSLMLFHGSGRLGTLCAFPSIFKGEHVKKTKMVKVLTGHRITVEFDRPTPLQIDGETILDVTSYTATSAKCALAAKQYVNA
jgi:diacylglycerol kinase family enzyme